MCHRNQPNTKVMVCNSSISLQDYGQHTPGFQRSLSQKHIFVCVHSPTRLPRNYYQSLTLSDFIYSKYQYSSQYIIIIINTCHMFCCLTAVSVRFSQSEYKVKEDNGSVQIGLTLSRPANITIQLTSNDDTATGKQTMCWLRIGA